VDLWERTNAEYEDPTAILLLRLEKTDRPTYHRAGRPFTLAEDKVEALGGADGATLTVACSQCLKVEAVETDYLWTHYGLKRSTDCT
jgi:hypothetical protein